MPLLTGTVAAALLFKLLLLVEEAFEGTAVAVDADDDDEEAFDPIVSVALAALAAATAAALSFIRSLMPGVKVIRGF